MDCFYLHKSPVITEFFKIQVKIEVVYGLVFQMCGIINYA